MWKPEGSDTVWKWTVHHLQGVRPAAVLVYMSMDERG